MPIILRAAGTFWELMNGLYKRLYLPVAENQGYERTGKHFYVFLQKKMKIACGLSQVYDHK